ncbi:MAG: DUF4249 domain-containing protein [Bacteroidota bacterium]
MCFAALSACIDEVSFPTEGEDSVVFVDGMIGDSLRTYQIRLGLSAELGRGNDNILIPLTGAKVEVHDDRGEIVEFVDGGDGYYQAETQAIVGRSYQLRVRLSGGEEVYSRVEAFREAAPISNISGEVETVESLNAFNNVVTKQSLNLKVGASLPAGERTYLRWRSWGEYEFRESSPGALTTKWCYVPDIIDLNQLTLVSSAELDGNALREQTILTTDYNHRFAYMYCFHVEQLRISEAEYQYWRQIELLLNRDGSLFDPPPGNVRGNLYDPQDEAKQVLGYFSVAGVAYKRQFISRDTTKVYVDDRCRFRFGSPTPDACIDCLTLNGSSTQRPDYWIP